jgi:hypothetical protein
MKITDNNENFKEGIDSKLRTAKYARYAKILTQVETNLLYEEVVIEGNEELELRREKDIDQLTKIISDELKSDNLAKILVGGKILQVITDENL